MSHSGGIISSIPVRSLAIVLLVALAMQELSPFAHGESAYGIMPQDTPPVAEQQSALSPPLPKPKGKRLKQTYISSIDGAEIDYAVWLPPSYNRNNEYPLIVFLHGSGEGKEWRSPTQPNASIPVLREQSHLDCIVVFPLLRGSWSINSLAEQDILHTIADVKTKHKVSEDRIHLVGISMGGYAAYRMVTRYPDIWASVTIFCAGGQPDMAINARNVPARIYHGRLDPVVPYTQGRSIGNALAKINPEARYIEFPQGNHVIWKDVLASDELYDWIKSRQRNNAPNRVSLRMESGRYNKAHWITLLDRIDTSQPATVDAFITPERDHLMIHADNVGSCVFSPPSTLFSSDRPVRIFVNGKPYDNDTSFPQEELHLKLMQPQDKQSAASAPQKISGQRSGPIQDVLHESFEIQFIPVASPHEADQVWLQAARRAFSWAHRLVYQNIKIHAAIDASLTDALDENAPSRVDKNIVLFGNPALSPWLKSVAHQLPVTMDDGKLLLFDKPISVDIVASVFIYPNPANPSSYLVTVLGEPAAAGKLAEIVLTPPYLQAEPLEDIVFMDKAGNIVSPSKTNELDFTKVSGDRMPSRGFIFDRDWRLSDQEVSFLQNYAIE